ncbi:erythromycin esterase family protein [Winogradskyella flava]|uniref:Erythromycin esterase family protein n=1 Tax=Winogradskyella flava TaxID=1884876 RepID=A0A842IX42_9FLAO|nr:erythromycin esterase family protein [Winogradskyella flava]MBC2846253.1 erythromycin esterase family protein [Winogradskyella flava]
MKRYIIILLIVLGSIKLACSQKQVSPPDWLNENTIELQPNGVYDFSKLKDVLKNRRIVALGESSHGLGKYYEMKSELVMYLHKELGYEVLAMEGGLGDINLAYADIDTISPKNLRDYTLFGNFKAQEVDTLFSYIKETHSSNKPLIYAGYDTQFSSNYFITKIVRLLAPINKTMSDSFSTRLYSFQKSFQAARNNDSITYIKHRNIFIKNANEANLLIKENKDSLIQAKAITEEDYQIIQRTLEMFVKSTNLSYADRYKAIELRDELMAENLIWLLDEMYPDKKTIVWAHNAHVEKNSQEDYNSKLMGHYLKEKYKEDYYALGLFAYEGNAYQFWTKDAIPFKNNDSTAIENRFFKTGKTAPFLDLSSLKSNNYTQWLFETNTAFELENGGAISFIPTHRFDGILSVKFSEIPTYD